jgi:hypothetical protein
MALIGIGHPHDWGKTLRSAGGRLRWRRGRPANVSRLKLAREGAAMTVQHLRDLESQRRHATLVAVVLLDGDLEVEGIVEFDGSHPSRKWLARPDWSTSRGMCSPVRRGYGAVSRPADASRRRPSGVGRGPTPRD